MASNSKGQRQQRRLNKSIAKSPLFKLPPEIRDMVYRFALVDDNYLDITKAYGIPEAPLLSVSKLIRSETYEMFYTENKFLCIVEDVDAATLVLKTRKFSGRSQFSSVKLKGRVDCGIMRRGTRDWKNLVAWVHLSHQRLCCGLAPTPEDDAEESLLVGLFDMVILGPIISSNTVDFLLKSMRPTLVKLHREWARD